MLRGRVEVKGVAVYLIILMETKPFLRAVEERTENLMNLMAERMFAEFQLQT